MKGCEWEYRCATPACIMSLSVLKPQRRPQIALSLVQYAPVQLQPMAFWNSGAYMIFAFCCCTVL